LHVPQAEDSRGISHLLKIELVFPSFFEPCQICSILEELENNGSIRGVETPPVEIKLQYERCFCILNDIFKSHLSQLNKFALFTGEVSRNPKLHF
jgi:hypothetical protein